MSELERAQVAVDAARERAVADPNRPRYHLLAPAQWMNDPNGPIYVDGAYQVFYQHNPYAPEWGTIHWGHARSRDLVHWEHLPIVLAPDAARGEAHCFSGCTVVSDAGVPTILYTSISAGASPHDGATLALATGSPDLLHWERPADNPILTPACHGDFRVREWRDPFVWREADGWYMVQGALLPDDRAAVLLYHSPDLRAWEYHGVLLREPAAPRGMSWECPNLFRIGETWVLLVSAYTHVRWFTGAFDRAAGTFTPTRDGLLDLGWRCYAPTGLRAPDGRRILWGWIRDVGGAAWNGVLTLPRALTVGTDGRCRLTPVQELAALRQDVQTASHVPLLPDSTHVLADACDTCAELELRIACETARAVTVRFESADGAAGGLRLHWDGGAGTLDAGEASGPWPCNGALELHVFVDRSVAEVYGSDGSCLTAAFQPIPAQQTRVAVEAHGGAATIEHADLWTLRSIQPAQDDRG